MTTIFGYEWEDISRAQQGGRLGMAVKLARGDYGADPMGDGMFRMVPYGEMSEFRPYGMATVLFITWAELGQ